MTSNRIPSCVTLAWFAICISFVALVVVELTVVAQVSLNTASPDG